ncbi:MAG: hypothetical protein AB1758_15200, partial [Candidatus Eremiobacterota bacterium]
AWSRPSGGEFSATLILEKQPLITRRCTLVVNGVRFELEKDWHTAYAAGRVILNTPFLGKDLSQAHVQLGPDFAQMLDRVKEEMDRLALELLSRVSTESDERVVLEPLQKRLTRKLKGEKVLERTTTLAQPGLKLARELGPMKLFHIARGNPISFDGLVRQFARYGYLATVDFPVQEPVSAMLEDGNIAVYASKGRLGLLSLFFSPALGAQVIQGRLVVPALAGNPRLQGEYLVRRMARTSKMEIGVPAAPPSDRVEVTLVRGSEVRHRFDLGRPIVPNGLMIVADSDQRHDDPTMEHINAEHIIRRIEAAVGDTVQDLMDSLLLKPLPEEPARTWVVGYILECFALATTPEHRGRSKNLFLDFVASPRDVGRSLPMLDLRSLAREKLLPTSAGNLRSVASLGHSEGPALYRVVSDVTEPSPGPEHLLLLPRHLEILREFLGPDRLTQVP